MFTEAKTQEVTPTITDEQRARLEEWMRAHPYGDQDENGIDLSLLRENLKLTPDQRLQRLQNAVNFLRRMRRDGRFTH